MFKIITSVPHSNFFTIFQLLVVSAIFLAAAVAAQDEEVPPGRTRICKEGEFPGKRVRRQVSILFKSLKLQKNKSMETSLRSRVTTQLIA
jgi:hypothetical protein